MKLRFRSDEMGRPTVIGAGIADHSPGVALERTLAAMGGTGRRALVASASFALAGCFVAYHPTRPREVAANGVAARVTTVTTLGDVAEVNVALKTPAGERTANAWLTTPATAPCSGGAPATSMSPGELHADERVLDFRQSAINAAGLFQNVPTVVDLDLAPGDPAGTRRCLRVPVADAAGGVEWRAWPRWFLAAGVRVIAGPPSAGPIERALLVSFGGGIWLGPLRLRADWLVGQARTDRLPPPGYGDSNAQLIGGDVGAEIFPVHAGELGIGVQVAYEYLATDFNAARPDGSASDVYDGRGPQGPRVALRIARLPEPQSWPSFRARPDHWSLGIDLFAARWFGLPGVASTRYGIALDAEWGRWW
jgi:hypothetical protein